MDLCRCPNCQRLNWIDGNRGTYSCYRCERGFGVQGVDPRDRFNIYEELSPLVLAIATLFLARTLLNLDWARSLVCSWVTFLLLCALIYFAWIPALVRFELFLKNPRERLLSAEQRPSARGEAYYFQPYPLHSLATFFYGLGAAAVVAAPIQYGAFMVVLTTTATSSLLLMVISPFRVTVTRILFSAKQMQENRRVSYPLFRVMKLARFAIVALGVPALAIAYHTSFTPPPWLHGGTWSIPVATWTPYQRAGFIPAIVFASCWAIWGAIGYWAGDREFEDVGMGRSGLSSLAFGLSILALLLSAVWRLGR